MKIKILLLFTFMSIIAYTFYIYIENSKKTDIDNLLSSKLKSVDIANRAILDTYLSVNKKYFYDVIHDKEVINILQKFKNTTSTDEKNILRGKLYRILYKEYDLLKKLGVNQFHFHTIKGESLLRFHMPYINGDSLLNVRHSIDIVSKQHKLSIGFESGRIYSGFRYVFPILYKNDYLGSVEFSMPFETIKEKLKDTLNAIDHQLILKKSASYDHVFKQYRILFKVSDFSKKYYIENTTIFKETPILEETHIINNLIKLAKLNEKFKTKFDTNQNFALPIMYKNKGYSITFLLLKNMYKQNIGYIISFEYFPELISIHKRYNIILLMAFLTFLIVFVLLIIVIFQFQKIKNESFKLQKFIDIQSSIVVLTDGEAFYFANKTFLDFFNYSTLDDFLKEHKCICEFFIDNENFFSLKNIKPNEKNWVESILNLPGRKRIVSMNDTTLVPHAFSISIGKYDDKKFVVSFNDISDTMKEKIQIQNQIVKDQLTGAYNRLYFEKNISKLILLHKSKNLKTGIIFFDIDHFKHVNDTFGHDVGDQVLVSIVNLVLKNIRFDDKLIRWGGEEFVIITSVHSLSELSKIANHIRLAIASFSFPSNLSLSCSFGVTLHSFSKNPLHSIKVADENLYIAKESGRNRVVAS